ncbi:nucleophosmin-like [Denticeps clupeoides]|uniref:nucleophosmin-like n=1 Tax=Denticeps clupeoides TaxID=299321 RepID=UPI0010A2EB24|nr:nucleophosmin-like [Denticeps clupeoides]XP_028840600.1 nucleophosmin-like [Denticeps clupeoides]
MHVIEAEGLDPEDHVVQTVIASLKPSTLPSVCLGGFEITPPVVFSLKSGSGPVYISGQHLIMCPDLSFDCNKDEEEPKLSFQKQSYSWHKAQQKKMKMDEEEDEEDYEEEVAEDYEENDYEEEVVEDYEENDYEEEVVEDYEEVDSEEESYVKAKTPEPKKQGRAKKPQTLLTLPEIKAKMMATVEKGVTLPKLLPKFENYMKNAFKVTDTKIIEEMWKWRQAVEEKKRSLFIF